MTFLHSVCFMKVDVISLCLLVVCSWTLCIEPLDCKAVFFFLQSNMFIFVNGIWLYSAWAAFEIDQRHPFNVICYKINCLQSLKLLVASPGLHDSTLTGNQHTLKSETGIQFLRSYHLSSINNKTGYRPRSQIIKKKETSSHEKWMYR
jgi:hypothetical protein